MIEKERDGRNIKNKETGMSKETTETNKKEERQLLHVRVNYIENHFRVTYTYIYGKATIILKFSIFYTSLPFNF